MYANTREIGMKEIVAKHTADACAAGIGIACVVEWLPPVAAALSITWLTIQIGEYIYRKIKG